jgi:hypothetical protein
MGLFPVLRDLLFLRTKFCLRFYHILQRVPFKHFDRGISDQQKCVPYAACLFVFAFFTPFVKFECCARHGGDRTIKESHYFRQVHLSRRPPQQITPTLSLFTT